MSAVVASSGKRQAGARLRPGAGGREQPGAVPSQRGANRQQPAVGREQPAAGRRKLGGIQRARIVAAMTEVASERGAGNVTVAHVVARSGVSRRTFYDLFHDRDDCLMAAFEEVTGRIAARVLPACEGHVRWQERIRAGLFELLGFLDEEPAAARLWFVETLAAGPVALERRELVLERARRAVAEGSGARRGGQDPPPLTAEGVVGAIVAVLHARLAQREHGSFVALLNPLMAMIVTPYRGAAAAARELERPLPAPRARPANTTRDPLRELDMRLTYRTVRVLSAVGERPGASNREVAQHAGIVDPGQTSKLLARLESLGLVANTGEGASKGAPNIWTLTPRGSEIEQAIRTQTAQRAP